MKSALLFCFTSLVLLSGCLQQEPIESRIPLLRTHSVTQITPEGARANAYIIDWGPSPIIRHGFVWGVTPNPRVGYANTEAVIGPPESEAFSLEINRALWPNRNIYLRAFVQTERYTIYADEESFFSLGSNPPMVYEVTPASVYFGETAQIRGEGFSTVIGDVSLWVAGKEVPSQQLTVTPNEIQFELLDDFSVDEEHNIPLTLICQQDTLILTGHVGMKAPILEAIQNPPPRYGEEVFITGKYWDSRYVRSQIVYINDQEVPMTFVSTGKIGFILPNEGGPVFRVQYQNRWGQLSNVFRVEME